MTNRTKSILFHYSIFNIGGAEKSVLRLTQLLVDRGWKVSIVFSAGGGKLESMIDPRIKIYYLRSRSAGNQFKIAKGMNKLKYLNDLFLYGIYWIEGLFKQFIFLFRKYDAVAISLHGLSPKFVCTYVRAKSYFHWIRNDLNLCDMENKAGHNIIKFNTCIDKYICVSETSLKSLQKRFPETINKSIVIPNILNAQQMLDDGLKISNPLLKYKDYLKVITVCRLSDKAKGLLRMVRVHKRLNDENINFRWFVIGDGPDKDKMKKAIFEAGLEDKMILLGSKENPFPYFKASDISATLSYYEGLCGAVNEAKIMGKPVLATEFSGIYDQIITEESGLIVLNEENAIYEGLKRLIMDNMLREKLSNTILPKMISDDDSKIDKLSSIIEEKWN